MSLVSYMIYYRFSSFKAIQLPVLSCFVYEWNIYLLFTTDPSCLALWQAISPLDDDCVDLAQWTTHTVFIKSLTKTTSTTYYCSIDNILIGTHLNTEHLIYLKKHNMNYTFIHANKSVNKKPNLDTSQNNIATNSTERRFGADWLRYSLCTW